MDTNMSKALMMVGGVVIAIIIISVLTLFIRKIAPLQQQLEDIEALEQTAEFNKQYEVYNKSLMLGVDLISVINKAASNNKAYIDAYGVEDYIIYNYLINIEFNLKNNLEETLEVYYIDESGNEEICRDITKLNELKANGYYDEIFLALEKNRDEEIENKNSLWERDIVIKLNSGIYKLLPNEKENYDKDFEYCTSDIYNNIIVNAIELRQIVKNLSVQAIPNDLKKGVWTKAVYNTSAYNLKTKKFKCTSVENSSQTGRIIKMTFQEI